MEEPGILSLLPVVVAIGLALWTRHVIAALLGGVFTASLLVVGGNPWAGALHSIDPLVLEAIADKDHVKVTVFSLFIAAAVEVMSKTGGTRALVDVVAARARTRRSGMVATWAAGLIVFFDDYANCLIVGNAMRPLTDKLKISREKLSFLVDTTAAPMATLALVSTWIGYEVGLMDQAMKAAHIEQNAYAFFLEGLPYRFYPIFALVFAGAIAFSGRDFGPMAAAEARARATESEPEGTAPPARRIWLAIVPIVALVAVTAASLWTQGVAKVGPGARLFEIVGGADGYDAMLHGSIAALLLALSLAAAMGAMTPGKAVDAAMEGMTRLFEALVVLFLAWALANGIGELHAADYLVGALGDSVPAWLLPSLVFVVAAAIAFATGTSFGTMGVLMPLVIPLAFATGDFTIALASSAAVLSGATWGDHCSPISDTTVLSSTGSGCEHTAHVTTQLPYAIAAGAVSLLLGTLPVGFGLSVWLVVPLGMAGTIAVVLLLGKKPAVQ